MENRVGAAGMIAAAALASSAPDGYTLMLGGGGETVANGALFKNKITYDPVKDLLPIHVAVKAPIILMVHSGTPFKSVPDLIAYAKANPGKLSYSSSGIGNLQHLAGELFNTMAGVKTRARAIQGCGERGCRTSRSGLRFLKIADDFESIAMAANGKVQKTHRLAA